MPILTPRDIIADIAKLNTNQVYDYFSKKSQLRIVRVTKPNGPIEFVRWKMGQMPSTGQTEVISADQLEIAASIFSTRPNYPVHLDTLFAAGGNTRSALETLLAHTPRFFICKPERTNPYTGDVLEGRRLKHIMWCPSDTHNQGETKEKPYEQVITRFELGVDFGSIDITRKMLSEEFKSIEVKRTHTQMQIALIEIGKAFDLLTWVATNDRPIPIKNTRLGNLEGVIKSLDNVSMFYDPSMKETASLIDCIWFTQDGKRMPTVFEVEHSTGVMSGLERMLNFKNTMSFVTDFVIVAPDNLKDKVVKEANKQHFRVLNAKFLPYSTVQVLYGLIRKYALSSVINYEFLKPFMEKIV